jgi:hypothetical protein
MLTINLMVFNIGESVGEQINNMCSMPKQKKGQQLLVMDGRPKGKKGSMISVQ